MHSDAQTEDVDVGLAEDGPVLVGSVALNDPEIARVSAAVAKVCDGQRCPDVAQRHLWRQRIGCDNSRNCVFIVFVVLFCFY